MPYTNLTDGKYSIHNKRILNLWQEGLRYSKIAKILREEFEYKGDGVRKYVTHYIKSVKNESLIIKKKLVKSNHAKKFKNQKKQMVETWTNEENRVLVIGDTHCPFDLDDYLNFLIDTYKTYNCNRVVHIGDEIDNHFSSYHETDADGHGGGQELDFAISRLSRYYEAFPNVDVIIGNHTRLVMRKAQTGGVPRKWLKTYNDVLEVPNWTFQPEIEIDGVLYIHGEGGTARTKARADLQSVVQGHLHTQLYVEYFVGRKNRLFGMQVGCGIDHKAYAFAYAKAGKKPAIGCGVVIGGHTAIAVPMKL